MADNSSSATPGAPRVPRDVLLLSAQDGVRVVAPSTNVMALAGPSSLRACTFNRFRSHRCVARFLAFSLRKTDLREPEDMRKQSSLHMPKLFASLAQSVLLRLSVRTSRRFRPDNTGEHVNAVFIEDTVAGVAALGGGCG
ncbi:MAG: hypothetical protein ACREJT_05480, partial [Myxococcota bacterium]